MTKPTVAREVRQFPIRSLSDINDAIAASIGRASVVVREQDLCPEFFDLRTGFAGEFFQKFVNYRVRLAVVISDPSAYGERFGELVFEHATHGSVRFFRVEEDARQWLTS
jgi:hypothetical protein